MMSCHPTVLMRQLHAQLPFQLLIPEDSYGCNIFKCLGFQMLGGAAKMAFSGEDDHHFQFVQHDAVSR